MFSLVRVALTPEDADADVTFAKGDGVASLGTAEDKDPEAPAPGRPEPEAPAPGPPDSAPAERTKSRSIFRDSGLNA